MIQFESVPTASAAQPMAIEPQQVRKVASKVDKLIARLEVGWSSAADLMAETGWQAHTLRGALSTLAKKRSVTIERQRENGVTSYRIQRPG